MAIPGNHDMLNNDRSRLSDTPYGVLVRAKLIKDPYSYYNYGSMYYGESKTDNVHPIIVAHYGLWFKEKPYANAPDSGNVEWFVNNCLPTSCRLFITGHYHVPFVTKVRNTVVVNCGCPFRMRADLIDYKPYVTIVTVDGDWNIHPKKHYIPLECEIRRDYIDDKKDRDDMLTELVGSIEGDFEAGFNFKENFYNLTKDLDNKVDINKEFERCINGFYR
jgi:DNA repair exonuclease SbcCD nuclease subunit